ncbi:hypothetical protein QYF36_004480 [Acer negundo]|nr:hypothetical protein QYF36_004480 [Acer negundo]
MSGNARKLAEKDESTLMASRIPYTINSVLQYTPGGKQGFKFEEVVNGDEKVSDWKECLTSLMEKKEQ